MIHTILVNIDELWLKGKNRKVYSKLLKDNILNAVHLHQDDVKVVQEGPKFYISCENGISEKTIEATQRVSGIRSLQLSRRCDLDIDKLRELVLEEMGKYNDKLYTFRVECKRSNKKFPLTSMELSRKVGGMVLKNLDNFKASMNNPDITLSLRVLKDDIFLSTKRIEGPGGLPVSTSGQMLTLLSGGLDSPVASYLMFRRGVRQDYIFFHAYPFVGDEVKEKVKKLVQVLARYQNRTFFHIVPFGDIQKKIGETCQEAYRTLLFRKYMVLTAEKLAKKIQADALILGDALSQVSSQTVANLNIVDRATDMMLLRPLVGFNKEEIIKKAVEIGTHDISIIPHDDACAMFAPKSPIIYGSLEYSEKYSQENDFSAEIEEALAKSEKLKYGQDGELMQKKDDLFQF